MQSGVRIRQEHSGDVEAISAVNRAAFGQDDEAELVDALRAGGYAEISLVAEAGCGVVGHLLLSLLSIETYEGSIAALALAPMAVAPEWQRRGVGSRLIVSGLEAARQAGHRIVVVLGHPEFYSRFEFSANLARPLSSPFSGDAWMALELVPGALAGVEGTVRYAEPFGIP